MNISPHFTLAEATITSQRNPATGQRYDNQPDNDQDLATIRRTADKMEAIRELFGNRPVIVNSWYRNTEVNKAVGGVPDSQHKLGEAVDFNIKGLSHDIVVIYLRGKMVELGIDQLILEPTWVHVSFRTSRAGGVPRNQYLDLSKRG